jgi:DNA (cytosine-5)-methyltransferase 1
LIPFDTTQITNAANRSNPQPGAPCHPLTAGGHPPAVAYGGNRSSGPIDVATAVNAHGRLDFESETFVAHCLRAEGFDASEDGTGRGTPLVPIANAVRRLTPTECERLQGFSDGYTAVTYRGKPAADGPRYKALGNSMAVNVMRWIGLRIAACEAVTELRRTAA